MGYVLSVVLRLIWLIAIWGLLYFIIHFCVTYTSGTIVFQIGVSLWVPFLTKVGFPSVYDFGLYSMYILFLLVLVLYFTKVGFPSFEFIISYMCSRYKRKYNPILSLQSSSKAPNPSIWPTLISILLLQTYALFPFLYIYFNFIWKLCTRCYIFIICDSDCNHVIFIFWVYDSNKDI